MVNGGCSWQQSRRIRAGPLSTDDLLRRKRERPPRDHNGAGCLEDGLGSMRAVHKAAQQSPNAIPHTKVQAREYSLHHARLAALACRDQVFQGHRSSFLLGKQPHPDFLEIANEVQLQSEPVNREEVSSKVTGLNIAACMAHGAGKYHKSWNHPTNACCDGVQVHAGDFSPSWIANLCDHGAHMQFRSS